MAYVFHGTNGALESFAILQKFILRCCSATTTLGSAWVTNLCKISPIFESSLSLFFFLYFLNLRKVKIQFFILIVIIFFVGTHYFNIKKIYIFIYLLNLYPLSSKKRKMRESIITIICTILKFNLIERLKYILMTSLTIMLKSKTSHK